MASSMLSTISSEKLQRFVTLLVNRRVLKSLNPRLYSNNAHDDKSDFFGIPEDFELQHYRHSASSAVAKAESRKTKSMSTSALKLKTRTGSSSDSISSARYKTGANDQDLVGEYHHKPTRRERRMTRVTQMNNYKTNFGVVSVDRRHNNNNPTTDSNQFQRQPLPKGSRNNVHETLSSEDIFETVLKPSSSLGLGHRQSTVPDTKTVTANTSPLSEFSPELSASDSTLNYNSSGSESVNWRGMRNDIEFRDSVKFEQMKMTSLSTTKLENDMGTRIMKQGFGQESEALPTSADSRFNAPGINQNLNEIDSQYFQSDFSASSKSKPSPVSPIDTFDHEVGRPNSLVNEPSSLNSGNSNSHRKESESNDESNLFDEYYFPGLSSENKSATVPDDRPISTHEEKEFNTIDDQYFGKAETSAPDSSTFGDFVSAFDINKDISSPIQGFHSDTKITESHSNKRHENVRSKSNLVTNIDLLHKRARAEQKRSTEESSSAFDLAMSIRMDLMKDMNDESVMERLTPSLDKPEPSPTDVEGITSMAKGRVDSKGFRILSDQVTDLNRMPSMDIVDLLKKSIVFDHEDFLVIDKPYGLPSIGQMNDTHSLSSLLPALGRALPGKYKASDLHLVQSLDRDVSGNVMLAKNPEIAYMMKGKFQANEVVQRFWAITKGVPSPRRGVIDIPIGVGQVGNVYKMVLRPQYPVHEKPVDKKRSRASCERAVTEFTVLSSHLQAALVECRVHTTGVKHQVRVHLSSGLNTPILGDHKYSHFSKLAPQKLDRSTLELLKVRQAKVRHISLHLHCRSLILPDYKSRTFVITSHLPSFFAKNMNSLKLYSPK